MNGMTITTSQGINTVADMNWGVVGSRDYDGDGKSDILWRNTNTGLNWMYLMDGTTIITSQEINTVNSDWEIMYR